MARPDVESKLTPSQFGEKLRAMVDPQTPEEWRQFHESQARIRQTERDLRRRLPPEQGNFVSSFPPEEISDPAILQTERLLEDVLSVRFSHDVPLSVDLDVLEDRVI